MDKDFDCEHQFSPPPPQCQQEIRPPRDDDHETHNVPEPGMLPLVLLGVGIATLIAKRRKK